jgi:hypothetical protein
VDSRVKNLYADGTITASNLNIVGDYVTMRTTTSNTEMMVIENAGTGPALKVTQTGANSIAEFYDDGGVLALKIADGGNVGIGTVNPQAKLHVIGAIKATTTINSDTQFLGPAADSATTPSFSFIDDTNTGIFRPVADNVGITCGGTERVRVLSNGNVGIGTTQPLATLTAFGSGQASLATFNTSTLGGTLHVCDSMSQVYNGGAVVFGTYQGNFAAIKSSIIDGTTNTVGHLSFYTRNTITDSTLTNRMTILNNGNVGIGTDNPQEKLNVAGSIKVSDKIVNASGRAILNQTGGVLQVINAFQGYAIRTGVGIVVTATITPSSTSSKILIIATTNICKEGGDISSHTYVVLRKNNTDLIDMANAMGYAVNVSVRQSASATHMDSPATTSAITYDIYDARQTALGSTRFDWRNTSITLMEIAG